MAITMLIWKWEILSKHFSCSIWGPEARALWTKSSPVLNCLGGRLAEELNPYPWRGRHPLRPTLSSSTLSPPTRGLAEPRKCFPCPTRFESKGGAGSNRKNNSVSQSHQYFSGAQVTARQGAPGLEHRWSLGPH